MQLPKHLQIKKILAAPRQSLIYLIYDESSNAPASYVLKVPRKYSEPVLEAYEDEYETLKEISHPVLPHYYGFFPQLTLGQETSPVPALVMEYIEGIPLCAIPSLPTKDLKKYILDLGDSLLLLLSKGVLYTDLHPGNLIITKTGIRLIDFTCAYYFLRNPYPSYTPKISYHLNPNLKGQQLLVQSLTFLLSNLPDQKAVSQIPVSLLELGKQPHSGLSFSDYLDLLCREWKI